MRFFFLAFAFMNFIGVTVVVVVLVSGSAVRDWILIPFAVGLACLALAVILLKALRPSADSSRNTPD